MITVTEVLAGSRRLDEMKEEVHEFVKILAGLIRKEDLAPHIKDGEATIYARGPGDIWWTINGVQGERGPYVYQIRFHVNGWLTTFQPNKKPEWFQATRKKVICVHESLQLLLDGAIKHFPELKQELELFKAVLS